MATGHAAVYIPSSLPTPELEILLAKAQSFIDEGMRVTLICCNGGTKIRCPLNIWGSPLICTACKSKRNSGLKSLRGNYSVLYTPESDCLDSGLESEIDTLCTKPDFKEFVFKGQDIGQSAYSTYTTVTRDQNLQSFGSAAMVRCLLKNSMTLYLWFEGFLKREGVDQVVLYNGRQNNTRPFLRAAQNSEIHATVMEFSGMTADCVYEFYDALPQDIDCLHGAIEEFWSNCNADKAAIAHDFFQSKRDGDAVNDRKSYVLRQTKGMLPSAFDSTKKNIAIFNSSEDEFAALGGEYDQTIYANQYAALEKLCASLKERTDIALWLRMHPNLSGVKWDFAVGLMSLPKRFPNIHVISPASNISTYALLDACDIAVSFGSTMTMEACYAGKPSILLGRCIYERFEGIYVPKNHDEVVRLLTAEHLKALESREIQKIAAFWKAGGRSIKHFTGDRLTNFRFREQNIAFSRQQGFLYALGKIIEKSKVKTLMAIAYIFRNNLN